MDPETQGRGQGDTWRRRFAALLVLSILLHVPLTPLAALFGLLRALHSGEPPVDAAPITAIPVDLFEAPNPPPAADPAPAAAMPEPPAPPHAAPGDRPRDAGVDAAPHAPDAALARDAGPRDAGAEDASADAARTADAGIADASSVAPLADSGAGDASAPNDAGRAADAQAPIGDPVVAVGTRRIADPNANVRIMVYTPKIREHPFGARISGLLRSIAQWRDFLGPTDIDPIRDVDQIYIVASQLRDSSQMVAILRHHEPARVRAALDALVHAHPDAGAWLDASVPVAEAFADRAERRFLLPSPGIVVITPPSAYAAALKLGKHFTLTPGSGPEAVNLYLATPWRAVLGLPLQIPRSIKWARVRVTPLADGGAVAELEAEDESPLRAHDDAAYLTTAARAATELDLGPFGLLLGQSRHRFVDHVAFHADGSLIRGEARVTAPQLSMLLDLAGSMLGERIRRRVNDAGG